MVKLSVWLVCSWYLLVIRGSIYRVRVYSFAYKVEGVSHTIFQTNCHFLSCAHCNKSVK